MKLIERYIYAVTRYLPENIREDVSQELRTHIEEMLPEAPTKDEIKAVLEELGNPQELSNEYQPQKRYLIGPAQYDQYISVLKLVVGIVVTVVVFLTALDWGVSSTADTSVIRLLGEIFEATFQGAIQSAMWVTIVFVMLERWNVNSFVDKAWSIKDLPDIPDHHNHKISRVETIFTIIVTVVFMSIFYFRPQILAIHLGDGANIPFFDLGRLNTYLPIILALGVIQLSFLIWQWTSPYWTLKMATVNAVLNTATCILFLIMLQDRLLYNLEFFVFFSQLELNIHFTRGIGISFVLINIFDSVNGFRKCRKLA